MTIDYTHEPTTPNGRARWFFDQAGRFYVELPPSDGGRLTTAGFPGPGCDPTTITDADAGLTVAYLSECCALFSVWSFAETREQARAWWRQRAGTLLALAARAGIAAPMVLPWWAPDAAGAGAQYAAERATAGEGAGT